MEITKIKENDMKCLISRTYNEKETLGYGIVLDGATKLFEFKTLELPLFIVPMKINSPKINCIPEGTYIASKIYSPSKGHCFSIHNVPNRTNILIHKGNFAFVRKVDTAGCILVGSKFKDLNADGIIDIAESTITLTALLKILPNEFQIIII
jgi:hypothetical protein